jgi:LCP family protein required for cell wall assembly
VNDLAEMEAYQVDDTVLDPTEEVVFQDSAVDEYLQGALSAVNEMQNILLLGIDARPGEQTGRSDTMIILSVDTEGNTIRMVSLMRDLYVEIPGYKNNRLNAAYVFGGADLLMQTIEHNFGIHVDNYVAVNFSMLANLIDQIGGLELTVESDYYKDRINAVIKCDNAVLGIDKNDGLLTQSGTQLMTGKQAQAYARYRYGTGDGDFGRTQRQREVIVKIMDKLRSLTLVELFKLAGDNVSNVYTNLSIEEIIELAPAALQLQDVEILQLRLPVDGGFTNKTVSGMSVLMPDRTKTKEALAAFYGE